MFLSLNRINLKSSCVLIILHEGNETYSLPHLSTNFSVLKQLKELYVYQPSSRTYSLVFKTSALLNYRGSRVLFLSQHVATSILPQHCRIARHWDFFIHNGNHTHLSCNTSCSCYIFELLWYVGIGWLPTETLINERKLSRSGHL